MRTKRGFTLIELMLVLAIAGVIAGVMVPRIAVYVEAPSVQFQRSVDEAGELALSGVPVRFMLRKGGKSRAGGEIVAEALTREQADDREVLEWRAVTLKHPPQGENWRMEPETVFFFSDGSCTPARISWAEAGTSERDAETFLLTVTGYCAEISAQRR